jgi:hypothetical protein
MNEQPPIPNNTEIDQALKEFEAKNNEGQTIPSNQVQGIITPQNTQAPHKEVEGVSFDTDKEVEKYTAIKFYKETVEPKMVKAVIKYSGGTVKNQRQAEWILLGFVAVAIGISLFLVFRGSASGLKSPTLDIIKRPPPAEGLMPSQ